MKRTTKQLDETTLLRGVRQLGARDSDLAMIVSRFGPPPMWERQQGFCTLIHIILEQQVSLASAKAAYDRLLDAAQPLTPQRFLRLSDTELKSIGFSRQKTLYGRCLANAVLDGSLDLSKLSLLDDDEAKARLMQVKGIGLWTAEIYLLMAVGRPNIWPTGDLAIAVAIQRLKRMALRPSPEELVEISNAWQPWRAVAARILWHFYLNSRQRGES